MPPSVRSFDLGRREDLAEVDGNRFWQLGLLELWLQTLPVTPSAPEPAAAAASARQPSKL